jgi:AcrR family transcriptional regulator
MSEKVNERNRRILDAAVELAAERGYERITRSDVAARAGVAAGSVNNAFGDMDGLRAAVMRAAVERSNATIVGQGLAASNAIARAAPDALKQSALAALAA